MLPAPRTDVERIENRYIQRSREVQAWRIAQQAALDAEFDHRWLGLLQERDRDFQAHGLDVGGQPGWPTENPA